MSKAYSNRALPSGTVLREWRLEEVLGVGGFGIVYKGRGIYFDELVAIKEYFPGSISEREADDTVVPIDSDAEEVHALGLKKFVEEAKLLWNLSTPTRHPNIVNVRSLFEIHGTAYMVMDFEDGVSLSKLLKQGTRFNERSLLNIIRPIAEGLDRAHRVGVLHRDIKPPNILVNPDGRPVLIDFGSARFEAAEATSTKVTFHTPPYAAIEQYVKTYEQGPWTDIYALGVVLYECVAGEKPPEVLERLHGGLGKPLADEHRPGYSRQFLSAIDAAMTIRPTDRPQCIPAWLALFDGMEAPPATTTVEIDEDATRIVTYDKAADEIQPVAPPAATSDVAERIETQVPDDPAEVEFKRAGHETASSPKSSTVAAAVAAGAVAAQPAAPEIGKVVDPVDPVDPSPSKKPLAAQPVAKAPPGKSARPVLVGGAAAAVLVAALGGWTMFGRGSSSGDGNAYAPLTTAPAQGIPAAATATSDADALPLAARTLADDAVKAGAPKAATDRLAAVSEQLSGLSAGLHSGTSDAVTARANEMRTLANGANIEFANALVAGAESKAKRLPGLAPVRDLLASLKTTAASTAAMTDPSQSLASARQALNQYQSIGAAVLAASDVAAAKTKTATAEQSPPPVKGKPPVATAARTLAPQPVAASPQTEGVSAGKMAQFNAVVDDARGMAKQVIRMGGQGRPGGGASDAERKGYQLRQANMKLASGYEKYLGTLKDSMRGAKTESDADRLLTSAKQTRAYLTFLVKSSSGSL